MLINLSFVFSTVNHQKIYRLRLRFNVGSWGKLIFVIPYRAYGEVNADLYLTKTKIGKGEYLFNFKEIASPVYYIQTIDFIPKEIHIRIADTSIKSGFLSGEKILKRRCKEKEFYCKTIPKQKRKSLPFLYKKLNKDIFTFRMFKNGTIPLDTVINRIEMFYAWPSNSEFGIPSYNMLAASLCFLNISYDKPTIKTGKYRILNINLNKCLNRVLYQAIPTVRRFVKLRQRRLFHLYFEKKKSDDKLIFKGIATPDVKVWGGFHIKKVIREVIFFKDEIILNRFYIEVFDKKGKGGTGELILEKVS